MNKVNSELGLLRGARRLAAGATVAVGALLAGMGMAAAQNTLVVAAVTTPKGFDGDVYLPGMVETVINVYENLFDFGRKAGANGREQIDASNMQGLLAESWTFSPDGKTLNVKLRNAKSPFGNELTADDVIFTYEKSVAQKRTGLFLKTVGSIDTIEKVSPKEVKFNLKEPSLSVLKVLTLYAPSLYDSKTVKTHATADDPYAMNWIAQNTAGFGAYQVQSVRPGEGAVMVANPNYFGKKPYYDRIVYREVPSPANRAALVKQGAAQWAEQVPMQAIAEMMKDPAIKVESVVGTGSAVVWLNAKYKPFDDVRVRRALAHATDYDAIGKTVFLGLGTRSTSYLAPSMEGYVPNTFAYNTDYNKAKTLLTEAGYANGVDVTLEYSDLYWWEEGVVIQMQESMKNAGIRVTPKRIPSTELRTRAGVGQRTLPMHTGATIPFVLDPGYAYFLSSHTAGSSNVSGYVNPAHDKLVEALNVETDVAKRNQMVAQVQKNLGEEVLAIETFFPGVYNIMQPCISGWVWRPVPYTYFRDLSCKK